MAYTIVGLAVSDRSTRWGLKTCIDKGVPVASRGIVREVSVFANVAGNFRISFFRDDGGGHYIYVGGTALFAGAANSITTVQCWIPVQIGDFIALYAATDNSSEIDNSGSTCSYQTGDITTTTLKSGWTDGTVATSVGGKVFSLVAPISTG